jgi:hypothetical protein
VNMAAPAAAAAVAVAVAVAVAAPGHQLGLWQPTNRVGRRRPT